jgi:hypothetical protein
LYSKSVETNTHFNMSFATKSALFIEAVNAGPYDFESIVGIDDFLVECLKVADFHKVPVAKATSGSTTIKTKKLTGYNLFMRETMAVLKAEEVPSKERMSEVSKRWKALDEGEKQEWKDKAAKEAPVEVAVKSKGGKKGPKKLTGYQLFVRETMPTIKADDAIEPKARLGHIGKLWKALSAPQQGEYKEKAALQG